MNSSAGCLSSGANSVYYGLKDSILDKDNDLFLSGRKKQNSDFRTGRTISFATKSQLTATKRINDNHLKVRIVALSRLKCTL